MSYIEATGPIKFALIDDAATAGDNELVAAVSGKKIRLLSPGRNRQRWGEYAYLRIRHGQW